jgi:hypothetical protein
MRPALLLRGLRGGGGTSGTAGGTCGKKNSAQQGFCRKRRGCAFFIRCGISIEIAD